MAIDWKNVKTAKVKTNGYKAINGYDITLVVENGTTSTPVYEDIKAGSAAISWTVEPAEGFTMPNKVEGATVEGNTITFTPETLNSDVTLIATCNTTTDESSEDNTDTDGESEVTYSFTSYQDAAGTTEWATGTVKTTGKTATYENDIYVEVEILTNTVTSWVGQKVYIISTAEVGDTIYQLLNDNATELLNVYVKITGKSSN